MEETRAAQRADRLNRRSEVSEKATSREVYRLDTQLLCDCQENEDADHQPDDQPPPKIEYPLCALESKSSKNKKLK
jgi:hypothetical protein